MLLQRRPVAEVLAREVDACLLDADFLRQRHGQRVAHGQVLQAQVADVLQVAVVHVAERARRGRVSHRSREVGVAVVFRPHFVQEVFLQERQVGV